MGNRTRERVGLVIFFALLLLGGAVLLSYFATGLTWTVYATSVDDRVGNMEGYTIVVYPGTTEPDDGTVSDAADAKADRNDDIPAIADTIGLRILAHYPKEVATAYSGVYISEVRELYEKKDAEVVTIDAAEVIADPAPTVVRADDKGIGVFGTDAYKTRIALRKTIEGLRDDGAEVVICVTKRMALLADTQGIDVVILTEGSATGSTSGYRVGDTLVVQAPEVGEAGVLLFSSNNVASARSIDAL